MRFKLDENLPTELVADLQRLGQEADTVWTEGLAGAPDTTVLQRARTEQRAVLTLDKGMADVRRFPPAKFPGIVLFRPGRLGPDTVLAFVRRYLPVLLAIDVGGRLVVITEREVRIR
jgi:predicted nuclease of predicted toxin-antitoxin system